MGRYLFVRIIKVAPFKERDYFSKGFLFQSHAHLLLKAQSISNLISYARLIID